MHKKECLNLKLVNAEFTACPVASKSFSLVEGNGKQSESDCRFCFDKARTGSDVLVSYFGIGGFSIYTFFFSIIFLSLVL